MTESRLIQKVLEKYPFFTERDGKYYSTFKELPYKMECSISSSNQTSHSYMNSSIAFMSHVNIFNVYFTSVNEVDKLNGLKYDFKFKVLHEKNNLIINGGFRAVDGVLDNEFYFNLMDNGINIVYVYDANNTQKEELKRMWTIRNIIK